MDHSQLIALIDGKAGALGRDGAATLGTATLGAATLGRGAAEEPVSRVRCECLVTEKLT